MVNIKAFDRLIDKSVLELLDCFKLTVFLLIICIRVYGEINEPPTFA